MSKLYRSTKTSIFKNAPLQAALFVIVLRLAGCTPASVQPADVTDIRPEPESGRVCLIVDPRWEVSGGWGTGVPIGDGLIATCLHVVRTPASSVSIDGREVPIEVIASGGAWHSKNPDGTIAHGDDWGDVSRDWLKFRVRDAAFRPAPDSVIDFNRPVRIGESIFLIGFPNSASKNEGREKLMTPTIMAGRVGKAPGHWKERIIAVEMASVPDHEHYGGLSGGAAAVYDHETHQWVVVGLFRGSSDRKYVFGPFEWGASSVIQVVRPPG